MRSLRVAARAMARPALAVLITVAVLGGVVPAGVAAEADGVPQVQTSTPVASVGDRVFVNGTGWSPVGSTVQIVICGQDAQDLSADCNQSNQYTAAIRAGGVFYGGLNVQLPPTPCPCVFLVTTPGSFSGVKTPVTIVGAPVAPIVPKGPPPPPVVLSASLDAPTSVSSAFGGPKDTTLLLRVKNTSGVTLPSPSLSVTVGHGADPTGYVTSRPMAPLAAGAVRLLKIPVTIPAFTYGDYTVQAQVDSGLGTVSRSVDTSSYPWALLVILVILLVLLLVWITRVLRRRVDSGDSEGPGDDAGEPDDTPPTGLSALAAMEPTEVPAGADGTPAAT